MAGERAWVEAVKGVVDGSLGRRVTVLTGFRLPYSVSVESYAAGYPGEEQPEVGTHRYQTDMLISERLGPSGKWLPRVVVEFKLSRVTSHDALTYSAKAATHKNVHPYLRYGLVIGDHPGEFPRRLLWHGHQFDFMMVLASRQLSAKDRRELLGLLRAEIKASRQLSKVLAGKSGIRVLHRKLATSNG